MDESHLDEKYFIDARIYNCPFCKRRHVSYSIPYETSFNWDLDKECYVFIVKCGSCGNESMHLSLEDISHYVGSGHRFNDDISDIDAKLLYSRPTSFFTMNSSIPKEVRALVGEAEEALQFNLLTGASASLRKSIYTLLDKEKCIITNSKTNRTDYRASIKALKPKFNFVNADLIDTLATIQGLASNPVHEDAWTTWDNKTLRFLIELTKSILNEMYVIPAERKKKRAELAELKKKLIPPKAKNTSQQVEKPKE